MKGTPGPFPYNDFIVYGPFLHRKEGRKMVCLIRKDGTGRTSTPYARYLMAVHLQRRLQPHEHVDHRDENKLNDAVENLQLLSLLDNNRKSLQAQGVVPATVVLRCPNCGKVFERRRRATFLSKGGRFTACSRHCAGKLRQQLQRLGETAEILQRIARNVVV